MPVDDAKCDISRPPEGVLLARSVVFALLCFRPLTNIRSGIPSPDFPGGVGESKHVGRTLASDVAAVSGTPGMRAMGLEQWSEEEGQTAGEKEVFRQANQTLGFA